MESQNPSNHGKANKKIKNQTLETKFRFELDLCLKNKDLAAAISLYDSAISHNIRLNHHHFNALLYLCSACVAAPSLRQTLDSSKSFAVEHGFRIFDHMLSGDIRPNEATITAMARVAAAKGDGDFAFDLVKTMNKHYAFPRLRTYDPALICFCENLEVGKAYEVEKHMGMMGVNAEEPELAALLDASAKTGRGDKVYEYLHKLRSSVGCISESTAGIIESWFASEVAAKVEGGNVGAHRIKEAVLRNGCGWHGLGWMGQGKWVVRRSNVDLSGRCCGCGERLVCIDIDREETDNFALSVASLAMEREVKTNFREFQAWLDEHADYEAIVDGANVGLYQQNFAEGGFSVPQLDAVVKEMYDRSQNKWPLVIMHNKRLRALTDQKLLEEWMGQGVLYATPNGSNDDWYWLYAAVKLKCLLVTNDEMRDHIFELLGRSFFMKWKERHQVRYTFVKGNLKLQMPPSYSLVIQESEKGSWHVPIAGESCDESSRSWLCISRPSSGSVISSNVSDGTAESVKVANDENKVAAINGKRKDRSPSPAPAHRSPHNHH